MKKANSFHKAEVQLQPLLSFLIFFCHFKPGDACKSAAYTNSRNKACAYQGARNGSFSENFANVLNQ